MRQQMNKEAKKLTGVKVKYSLYDKSNNEINGFGYNYTILWHDTKMKNYLDLIKNLPTKHIATSRIVPILVVDKVEQMVNIYNIEKEIVSKPIKQRRLDRFGLFTDNTDTEKKKEFIAQINKGFNIMVLRIPDKEDNTDTNRTKIEQQEAQELQSAFGINNDDGIQELKLEKNFYYVLDENNVIIDAAKIYNFDHEDSIYQRISTIINKDIEDKRNMA